VQRSSDAEPQEFAALMPRLEKFPFPDVPCLIADFHLSEFRRMRASAMEACRKNVPEDRTGHEIRRIAAAMLDGDEFFGEQCLPLSADTKILWSCLDASIR
jgi:hypothetical protein